MWRCIVDRSSSSLFRQWFVSISFLLLCFSFLEIGRFRGSGSKMGAGIICLAFISALGAHHAQFSSAYLYFVHVFFLPLDNNNNERTGKREGRKEKVHLFPKMGRDSWLERGIFFLRGRRNSIYKTHWEPSEWKILIQLNEAISFATLGPSS